MPTRTLSTAPLLSGVSNIEPSALHVQEKLLFTQSWTICCPSRNCATGKSNSFCACCVACRGPGDLVNTCNLERRLEVTCSNFGHLFFVEFERLYTIVDRVGAQLICSTPRKRNVHDLLTQGEKQTNVLWRPPQLRLH